MLERRYKILNYTPEHYHRPSMNTTHNIDIVAISSVRPSVCHKLALVHVKLLYRIASYQNGYCCRITHKIKANEG